MRERRNTAWTSQAVLYYAMERFLFRLPQTQWSDLLVVKGAVRLRVWAPRSRGQQTESQPAPRESGTAKSSHYVGAGSHQTPSGLRAMILDHEHHRTKVDSEVV